MARQQSSGRQMSLPTVDNRDVVVVQVPPQQPARRNSSRPPAKRGTSRPAARSTSGGGKKRRTGPSAATMRVKKELERVKGALTKARKAATDLRKRAASAGAAPLVEAGAHAVAAVGGGLGSSMLRDAMVQKVNEQFAQSGQEVGGVVGFLASEFGATVPLAVGGAALVGAGALLKMPPVAKAAAIGAGLGLMAPMEVAAGQMVREKLRAEGEMAPVRADEAARGAADQARNDFGEWIQGYGGDYQLPPQAVAMLQGFNDRAGPARARPQQAARPRVARVF